MAPLTATGRPRLATCPVPIRPPITPSASAGLLISEGSQISHQGQGYLRTPGIYSPEQVAGWRKVTDAVHKGGGRIFIQLSGMWAACLIPPCCRTAPRRSAPPPRANTKTFIESGFADVSEPRALELSEIPGILRDYENAARNAKEAGSTAWRSTPRTAICSISS